MDVQAFLEDLCARLEQQSDGVTVECRVAPLRLSAEPGIAVGLLVTELVTNAFKYAYTYASPRRTVAIHG